MMSADVATWFPNRVAAILFVMAFVLWAVSEVYNRGGLRHHRRMAGTLHSDRGSYWLIALVVWGSIGLSLFVRSLNLGVFRNNLQYLGLAMQFAGMIVREWAVWSLGSFFTVTVSIVPNQTLVQRGPYRWLRHPAYTGTILTLIGFPLSLGSWVGALLAAILCFLGFSYRIQVEESALLAVFGEAYRDYMRHTWRLFPGV